MSPELHQRVRKLFDEALERPEEERLPFLQTECSGDPGAYQAVVRLLQFQQPAQSFLESRAPGMERIGRYLITGELGRGAMGVVYEAVDPLIRRSVAVKVIHLHSLADRREADFMRDRLFREARSAGQLLHPGIVILFDVGQEGDLAFITMERVDGQSLQQILASGQGIGRGETLEVLRQTAAALDHAHQKSVVHCDVKPGNIMLDKSGVAKLTDFGIAKIASTQYHTRSGLVMGTPSYMSPEQIEGRPLDGRSDQFSLAVVAFQLLTGSMPFQANSIAGMAYAIVHAAQPSARAANPGLPPAVDQVLCRGLHKLPGERFPSCTQFVTALEAALASVDEMAGATAVLPPVPSLPAATSRPRLLSSSRRKVLLPYLVGAFLLAALAGGYWWLRAQAPPAVAFLADAQSIKSGASAKLRWDVGGATKVMIDHDVGEVPANGDREVKPSADTVYTLTATGRSGQITVKSVSLDVVVDVAVAADILPAATDLYTKGFKELDAGHRQAAINLFREAAGKGETQAMYALGDLYSEGEKKDYREAAKWFRRAADGHNARSMTELGGMYYFGRGVPQNYGDAAYWFGQAADSREPAGAYNLGMLYENGQGVSKDLSKAEKYYRDAARLGNEEAKKRLLQLQAVH